MTVRRTANDVEGRARALRDQLSLEEKLTLLSGVGDFWLGFLKVTTQGAPEPFRSGSVPRLGIDGCRFIDGPRGIAMGPSTCFPVAMARAATFDPQLEERVGDAMGREARAQGANVVGAPCIEVLRHPAWGRAQETYGEDPHHNGMMGAALVRGLQRHVMACAKHLALNSIENARFRVDVRASEETLENVYLVPFEHVVREGVASVMTAYNSVNGEWCGQNRQLITTILKERWGFDGFAVSDWGFGIRDGVKAVNAGLDLEMPDPVHMGRHLLGPVQRGEVPLERIDDAVLRLLRQQLRFADGMPGERYGPDVVACEEHRALAREVATRAIVLLRNQSVDGAPVLPLRIENLRRVAVIGHLAAVANLGDKGSSNVHPPYVVTPLDGLRAALRSTGIEVVHDEGADLSQAAATAAAADVAILVVGYTSDDEGERLGGDFPPADLKPLLPPLPAHLADEVERALARMAAGESPVGVGGDRKSLRLHEADEALIQAVAAANPRVVVAIECGSAVIMESWRHSVPGILLLWYPGMEGGHALADILLGRVGPSGRLPFAIPTSEAHLPFFDPEAATIEYGPLHGQNLLDHLGVDAAYPFGFGLTYA
jgi:beta-glucosidase